MRNHVATLNDNWLIFVKVQGRTQDQLQNQGDEKTVSSILEQTKCALQVSKYLCFFWCLMLQTLGHRVLMFKTTIYACTCYVIIRPRGHVHSFHLCTPFCKSTSTLVCCKADWIWCRLANAAWHQTEMMHGASQPWWQPPETHLNRKDATACASTASVYDKPKMIWPRTPWFQWWKTETAHNPQNRNCS